MQATAYPYQQVSLPQMECSPQSFCDGSQDEQIRNRISIAMEQEAPIAHDLLAKRVINSMGMYKLGRLLAVHFDQLLDQMDYPTTVQQSGTIYWNHGQDTSLSNGSYRFVTDEQQRYSYHIPVCEMTNAMADVLGQHESAWMTVSDLQSQAIHNLGYIRQGASLKALAKEAIAAAVETGLFQRSGNGRIRKGQETLLECNDRV